jgi:hypothetical protein
MRHPYGWHTEDVGEHFVGQRATEIGKHVGFLPRRLLYRVGNELRPRVFGVQARNSRGRPIKFIPKLTELACAELDRREEIANPRRAVRSGARAG